jgi:hypothetical protein
LLSARHFAEAAAIGSVSGVQTRAVIGGLAALGWFRWLAEILMRVEAVEGLADGFIRQARWSHHVTAVSRRVSFWAERMSEWSSSGDDREGKEAWRSFDETVLSKVEKHVAHVRSEMLVQEWMVKEWSTIPAPPSLEELRDEGRLGAAQKQAREHAEHLSESLKALSDEQLRDREGELIEACFQLAEFGDPDAAAVIIAPFVSKLDSEFYRGEARRLLNRSRLRAASSSPPGREEDPSVYKARGDTGQEPYLLGGEGESASVPV